MHSLLVFKVDSGQWEKTRKQSGRALQDLHEKRFRATRRLKGPRGKSVIQTATSTNCTANIVATSAAEWIGVEELRTASATCQGDACFATA
jgi:hypothetical protein